NLSVPNNSVIIHPPGFYIVAFQTFSFISVYFIFLAFIYVVTLLFNSLLIYIITSNHSLHTPKFLAVANLAVIDVILSTSIIPGMIKIFLFKDNFVPFNLCLVQMYFYYSFGTLESFALAILAYDRLIAICFPMRQNSINTLRSMSCIVGFTSSFALGINAFAIGIMTQLSFCSSLNVFSYFCDYAPVFRLACNDNTLHWFVASSLSVLILGGPLIFIFLSYVSILVTVFRMKSLDGRVKALATCVEHLILVAVYYIPLFTIFTVEFYLIINLSLTSFIPPMLNPIIYVLQTQEIKESVKRLLKISGKSKVTIKKEIIM
uniref:G-protein coupled receptors family 1 profile domain-containing protein n=1 Tax=Anabas testudineus TaxID=64144 RepID=A0A3Q1HVJ3_ANATE